LAKLFGTSVESWVNSHIGNSLASVALVYLDRLHIKHDRNDWKCVSDRQSAIPLDFSHIKSESKSKTLTKGKQIAAPASFMSSLMACTWHLSTLPCRIYGLHSTILLFVYAQRKIINIVLRSWPKPRLLVNEEVKNVKESYFWNRHLLR